MIHHIKTHTRPEPQGRLMYLSGHSLKQGRRDHSLGIRLGSVLSIRAIRGWFHSQISCLTPYSVRRFNPLNPELNPICYLLALLGAHHFLHVRQDKG